MQPSGTSDMMEKLEDSIMTLSSMSTSRASLHFRDEIKSLIKALSNFEESMQLWLSTQSVWAYMEAVFEEGDIACQLPEEAARFSRINSTYLQLIHDSSNNLLIMYLFDSDGMREQFVTLLSELEVCQNSLSAYLGMCSHSYGMTFSNVFTHLMVQKQREKRFQGFISCLIQPCWKFCPKDPILEKFKSISSLAYLKEWTVSNLNLMIVIL